ncbi:MAG: AAA family ATPase [Candidatus Bathyarchaeia archaeon]|jgi:ATP-dependent exoDNAse (exonuclease V) alpha subunit
MTKHLSVRLLWHDNGWNGCICNKPAKNTYCYADKSVPITVLKDNKQDPKYIKWETDNAGERCADLDTPPNLAWSPPRCTWSINAFSPTEVDFVHIAQLFMKAGDQGVQDFPEKMPPYSMGTWKFDDMYPTRFRGFENVDIYTPFYVKQREELSREYYKQFDNGKSLVFTYLNTDNPLNNERQTYVLVGVCKLKEIGHPQRWAFQKKESHQSWGDLVWSRRITQSYSPKGEGLRIPYQEIIEYQKNHPKVGDLLAPVLFEIDNSKEIVRKFKYVSRDLTDIEAASIIQQLIPITRALRTYQKKYGICPEIDWAYKEKWLGSLLASTYTERSKYPGLVAILDCLHFDNASIFFNEILMPKEKEGIDIREYVRKMLETGRAPKEFSQAAEKANKYWKNSYSQEEKNLMLNILSLIDLRPRMTFESEDGTQEIVKNQVEKILHEDRARIAGIESPFEELVKNPYLICEEYQGEDPDDFITFDRIDAAFFPAEDYWRIDPSLKMDPNDPKRVRAKIIQILKSRESNGDCFLNVKEILQILDNSNDLTQKISITLRDLRAEKEFYERKLFWKPVEDQIYLYRTETHEMEEMIETKIRTLIHEQKRRLRKVDLVKLLKKPSDSKFPQEVLTRVRKEKIAALKNAYQNKFSVITGIAGSGKTTLLEKLTQLICQTEKADMEKDFLFLAPTGKAAIRLSEAGKRAFTIDYILNKNEWVNPHLEGSYLENGKPLNFKNIIIDESSMIDLEKLSVLFKAINWEKIERLILAGDVNQLPPIGLGKPFFDIIQYLKNDSQYKDRGFVSYLNINCRQILTDSQAAKLANIFRSTEEEDPFWEEMILEILNGYNSGDLEVAYWEDELALPELICEKIDHIAQQEFKDYPTLRNYDCFNRLVGAQREELRKKFGAELVKKYGKGSENRYSVDFFQIITPYKQDFFGTTGLNYRLQHKYHSALWSFIPRVKAAPFGRVDDFTQFDKIIQTKNRYRQWFEWDFKNNQRGIILDFLANGQLGTTRVYKSGLDGKRYLQLEFKGEEDKLLKADANFAKSNLELAYVLTVHKVQGSQFNVVILIIPEKIALISKELIYTALTRQTDKLVLLIQNSAKYNLLHAKTNSSILNRNSSIFFHYDVRTSSEAICKQLIDNHIHRTNRLDKIELVTSKSEAIIANLLLAAKIPYEYEKILDCPEFPVKPDFTFLGDEGKSVLFWEHLGMWGDKAYDEKWERKRQGYEKYGYTIITKEQMKNAKGHKCVLITREHKGAIDSTEIQKVVDEIKAVMH